MPGPHAPDPLAQRILARPGLARQLPAHDRDQRTAVAVALVEEASALQRDAQRFQVPGAHQPVGRDRHVGGIVPRTSLDLEDRVEQHAPLERHVGGDPGAHDAGQGADSLGGPPRRAGPSRLVPRTAGARAAAPPSGAGRAGSPDRSSAGTGTTSSSARRRRATSPPPLSRPPRGSRAGVSPRRPRDAGSAPSGRRRGRVERIARNAATLPKTAPVTSEVRSEKARTRPSRRKSVR